MGRSGWQGGEVGLGCVCSWGDMQSRPCGAEGSGVSWGSGDDGMIGR